MATTSKKNRSDTGSARSIRMSGQTPTRRRATLRELQSSSIGDDSSQPKVINAAPSLARAQMFGIDDERPPFSRIMGLLGRIFLETIPQLLAAGAVIGLIFGGCCSNVFALEAIIQPNPDSGTLLTCVQFIFVAATSYASQFDSSRPPFFLKANRVPIRRWVINITLFFTINVLNNLAFSYNISVPIHIILRSGGSITTLAAGYLYGKRFSRLQVISVVLLTMGVIIAAWSDAQSKERTADTKQGLPPFSIGLIILFVAQILSAIMGLYIEDTYREYGPHWKENLFYSHFLSLPLFLIFLPSMSRQFMRLAASPPLALSSAPTLVTRNLPTGLQSGISGIYIPSQLAFLVANVLTQYACIRGVNLLASTSSALTVTIVLNVRKLISLLLSIWLFGNRLSPGTLVGAVVVFTAGGMYSLDGSKGIGRPRNRSATGTASINGRALEK